MQILLLLMFSVFASEDNKLITRASESKILVKIEEDEYIKTSNSHFIGVAYNKRDSTWRAGRWSKNENKNFCNGTCRDEETAARASDTLARKLIANGEKGHKLNFHDDNIEVYSKAKRFNYIGVAYKEKYATWCAQRHSIEKGKMVYNGTSYKDEETAAHASDTLVRKLIANGEKGHKLNFPDDNIEVWAEKTSNYIGVSYNKKRARWRAQRHSTHEKKKVYNGHNHKDEEAAAHASDTLARKLIANGEKGHKLNFPEDHTIVSSEKTTNYFGVRYNNKKENWRTARWSKNEYKYFYNGTYKNEQTAAHASDTLARKLIANGEKGHKLNFPDNDTNNQTNKRKRPADFMNSQKCGNSLNK